MSEKFISPCSPPTAREREILEILIEECAEVQQRCTKALRFGLKEVQPGQPHDNAYRIGLEIGDVLETLHLAQQERIIGYECVTHGQQNKHKQLAKFMQTEPPHAD